ncbi:Rho termination factor N-terminal domain-containing protein [Myxosarcina sp. GI1]|uniref:Rho termination factor N-terminal domain-containing protein n=1 Tax=Myxosarcina sp. GI1 TaxID=1541065 RepID=UPI00056A7A2D
MNSIQALEITLYILISAFFLPLILQSIALAVTSHIEKCKRINSIPTMTVKQLRELAKDYKIKNYSRLNKYDLANVLISHI